MDKRYYESYASHTARRARISAQRAVARAHAPSTPKLKSLTPNQLDALKQRRLEEDAARRRRALAVFYHPKRERLPVPDKFSHAKTSEGDAE